MPDQQVMAALAHLQNLPQVSRAFATMRWCGATCSASAIRNLALAACLVFLTIAAVTGWQIVSDRNARQLAEQERSLVATISKAEKSLDHLEAGNRRMAAKLAVETLDARPGEEVLPQTYRALYAVLTSGGKPIHFEIADNIPPTRRRQHRSVGDGEPCHQTKTASPPYGQLTKVF